MNASFDWISFSSSLFLENSILPYLALRLILAVWFLVLLYLGKIALYPGTVNAIIDKVIFRLTLSWENSTVAIVSLTLFLGGRFSVWPFSGKIALYNVYR